MKRSIISGDKKTRGRPKTGVGTVIGQRWHDDALASIDEWRRKQPDLPSRAEAIRRLVEMALKGKRAAR